MLGIHIERFVRAELLRFTDNLKALVAQRFDGRDHLRSKPIIFCHPVQMLEKFQPVRRWHFLLQPTLGYRDDNERILVPDGATGIMQKRANFLLICMTDLAGLAINDDRRRQTDAVFRGKSSDPLHYLSGFFEIRRCVVLDFDGVLRLGRMHAVKHHADSAGVVFEARRFDQMRERANGAGGAAANEASVWPRCSSTTRNSRSSRAGSLTS
jgi:hypothetical protein